MLNLDVIARTPLQTAPFPHLAAGGVLDAPSLEGIAADFPAIDKPGIFPPTALTYGQNFARLLEEIDGAELEAVISEKFGVDLSDKPLMIHVRGQCQKRDGRIHTDSTDKVITCLLYLNAPTWTAEGGNLRLLRDGKNLANMIAEVPPIGGNFIAFQRTENSWHGHAPFIGPRRYVMFNWVRSNAALARNLGRHRFSAMLKRLGWTG